jgi:glycine/D-amino acid oxidase-like deaminating enzyme
VTDALRGDAHTEVVVVGGGLSGCVAALELTRRHRPVILLEAGACGSHEPRTGHAPTGPAHGYERASAAERRAWEWTREGHAKLRDWISVTGVDCGYRQTGGFLIADGRAGALQLAADEDELRDEGFASEFLDHYMLEARFDVKGAAAALWVADDGELDARPLVAALAGEAVRRGARVHEHSPVLRLEVSNVGVVAVTAHGRVFATAAIVAAGEGSSELLPQLDHLWLARVLTGAEHRAGTATLPSPVRTLDAGFAWAQRGGELNVTDEAIDIAPEDLGEAMARSLTRHLGPVGPARRTWTTHLSATHDGWPLVGRLGASPLACAAGYGDLALTWAPLAALWAVESLVGSRDPVPREVRASRGGPASEL